MRDIFHPLLVGFLLTAIVADILNPKVTWKRLMEMGVTFEQEGLLYHVDPADVPSPNRYFPSEGPK